MQLHVLDATYELFRAYFGAPPRQSPTGVEVGAVNGMLGSTLSLLREEGVTHLAAATDQVIESFRNRLFPSYKTGEGIPDDLLAQFPIAEQGLRSMGVTVWAMVEFEADDAMATAAWIYADDVDRVVLLSPDKDLAQCVIDGSVVTYDRRQEVERNEGGVWEKFGVAPVSIPDYLALVGDTADGLPGLPGWGAKSTSTVLAHYRTLEEIPSDSADWEVNVRGAAKLAATLDAHRADALLYRELATLRRDVPLSESIDELEWRGADPEEFGAFCEAFGLDGLANRPHRWQSESTGP